MRHLKDLNHDPSKGHSVRWEIITNLEHLIFHHEFIVRHHQQNENNIN